MVKKSNLIGVYRTLSLVLSLNFTYVEVWDYLTYVRVFVKGFVS